jgi:hypothetical protein
MAAIYTGGSLKILPTTAPGMSAIMEAINDKGEVIGVELGGTGNRSCYP